METIIEILNGLHPDADVNYETCDTLVEDGILDSFTIVTLIAEIGSRLGVVIPAHEIIPENFNSAEALNCLINRLEDEI